MLETIPTGAPTELELALNQLLRGILGIADKVQLVTRDNIIVAEIHKPRIKTDNNQLTKYVGGPIASVVAALSAEAYDKPVIISKEVNQNGKCSVEIEVQA